jgi:hypothetical protein
VNENTIARVGPQRPRIKKKAEKSELLVIEVPKIKI